MKSVALISGLNASTAASTADSFTPNAFGFKAITFVAEVNSVMANALPEKAVFFTRN
ncbi:hypothetical protein D3C87_2097000 [compost metagenome]